MGRARTKKINQRYVKAPTPEDRQAALEGDFGKTLVDRKFIARVIETYDARHVQPIRDLANYLALPPHSKVWLWLMPLRAPIARWLYVRGWLKPKAVD